MPSKEPSPIIPQEERVATPTSDAPSRASSTNYALPSLRVGPTRGSERAGDHRPSLSSISIAGSVSASSHARGSSTASAEVAPKGGGILLNPSTTLGRVGSTRVNGHARASEDTDSPLTAKQSTFQRSFSVASSNTERRASESKERDGNPRWGMTASQPPPAPSSGAGTGTRPSMSTQTSTNSTTSGAITESSHEMGVSTATGPSTTGRQQGLRRFGSLLRGR